MRHDDIADFTRIKATIIMLKTIIALGVLAMPTVLSATGGVPGSLSESFDLRSRD